MPAATGAPTLCPFQAGRTTPARSCPGGKTTRLARRRRRPEGEVMNRRHASSLFDLRFAWRIIQRLGGDEPRLGVRGHASLRSIPFALAVALAIALCPDALAQDFRGAI